MFQNTINGNVDLLYGLSFVAIGIVIFSRQLIKEAGMTKNYLDDVIQSMSDGLIIIDTEKNIKSVNPRSVELLGYYNQKEMKGLPISDIFTKNEPFLDTSSFKELLTGSFIRDHETACRRRNGNNFPVLLSVSVIKSKKGRPEGLVIIIRDITERKWAEEELKNAYNQLKISQYRLIQAEKMDTIGKLASGVAHEVKNPLAIILQGIDYLSLKIPPDNEEVSLIFKYISEAVMRADNIIKSLMDFSRMTEVNPEPENINYVIDTALMLIKNNLDSNHIEVVKNFPKDIPLANLDKNKISQVFINIIMNAIDAMPGGGKLNINTYSSESDKMVVAEIEDFGAGMPKDIVEKIFEPFFTTKRSKGGTGLGLAVVKNIVDVHHGEIEIKNKSDSKGVKAILKLRLE